MKEYHKSVWQEIKYLELMHHILVNGFESNKERTGTGTLTSDRAHQLYFPAVAENFPLFTTKYVSFNMLACEMLWFISGSTNTDDLREMGSDAMADMWDNWANGGDLGPVYGKQWRDWKNFIGNDGNALFYDNIDQLKQVINGLQENPESRRHIVTAWNPDELDQMALPPCHLMYQFTCEPLTTLEERVGKENIQHLDHSISAREHHEKLDKSGYPKYRLHLHLTQRSCDMFLGVPFNVAEYALLLLLVSEVVGMKPGGFTWTGVNCHIYKNHVEAVRKQIMRTPKEPPQVTINGPDNPTIDDFERDHIELKNYNHHPKIEAEVSV